MTQPKIITVACLEDNYAYLLHDPATGATACVDVPDAAPIKAALDKAGWTLSDILITHHHWDHVDGVADLVASTGARVIGARADAHRLPPLDMQVADGDRVSIGKLEAEVIDVSGHTIGHIAFYIPAAQAVFTADSLMALGCGRLFEGTPEMMWGSLQKLMKLPPETLVCSGHEYTASNARFALSVDPQNTDLQDRVRKVDAVRAEGRPTVPSTLADELRTNPFLRPDAPDIAARLGLESASTEAIFAATRAKKDTF